MTGKEFERLFCNLLQKNGYWALNIPKDERGAQPFDVIAIRLEYVIAADCKVCTASSFPLSRVEDNQWTAFETMSQKTSANIGLAIYNNGEIRWLQYSSLKAARDSGVKAIKISSIPRMYSREDLFLMFTEKDQKL